MNRKKALSRARTPKLLNNLPPLSKLRGNSETPTGLQPDLNLYSLIQEGSANAITAHRFFTPTNHNKSPAPSSVRMETGDFKEEVSSKATTCISHWEISERLESFQIRSKQGLGSYIEEFNLWNQCANEIFPMLKRQFPEVAPAFLIVTSKMNLIFKETQKANEACIKKAEAATVEGIRRIKALEEEIGELKKTIDRLQDLKRAEMKEINKEIDEIFGDNTELEMNRLKAKKLQLNSAPDTAMFLSELYQQMNKEYYIPEGKTFEMPSTNIEEFNKAMAKKFVMLQKNTANRIFRLIEESKIKADKVVQTVEDYISPQDYEIEKIQVEKISNQYQLLLSQFDSYKEESSGKFLELEELVKEKTELIEKTKCYQKTIENIVKENENIKQGFESYKIESEKLLEIDKINTIKEFEAQIHKLNTKLSLLNTIIDNKSAVLSAKDEKIRELEENYEKLRLKKSKILDPKPEEQHLKEKTTRTSTELQHTNEPPPVISDPTSIQSTLKPSPLPLSDSKSTFQEYTEEDLREDHTQKKRLELLLESSNPADPKIFKDTPEKANRVLTEGSLPTRVNSRDVPLARVDEIKEIKSTKIIKERKQIKLQGKPRINLNNFEEVKKAESLYYKNAGNADKSSKGIVYNNESEEEFQINKGVQWNLIRSHLSSRESKNPPEADKKIEVIKCGIDKSIEASNDFKYFQVENYSKGVQVNEGSCNENPEIRSNTSRNIYYLPYNPNNAYGLKGDNYFNSKNQTFQAQPRIPDLSSSILFQNSYYMEKDRERQSDLPSYFVSKC